jgi:hypothetical protein
MTMARMSLLLPMSSSIPVLVIADPVWPDPPGARLPAVPAGQLVTSRPLRTSSYTPVAIHAASIAASCSAQIRTWPVRVAVFPLRRGFPWSGYACVLPVAGQGVHFSSASPPCRLGIEKPIMAVAP